MTIELHGPERPFPLQLEFWAMLEVRRILFPKGLEESRAEYVAFLLRFHDELDQH